MQISSGTTWKRVTVIILFLIVLALSDLALGSVSIPFFELLNAFLGQTDSIWHDILWQFRIPKTITCILAGGALATGGLMMQTLFRNPLAGPDVLGLSAGSSLLVALLILMGQSFSSVAFSYFSNPWSIVIASSLGGMLVFLLVIGIANFVKDNASLLIIGLMLSAATSSIVSVLQFTSRAEDLQAFMIWSLGNVGSASWEEIQILIVVTIFGLTLAGISIKSLNSLLLGENYAQSLGINIKRSRLIIVASAGFLTGGVTAFCGPIAFVGLAVPHLVRLILPTANHQVLLPATLTGGACLLLFCDIISQLPGSTQALPLNAVTSMIGAPVVIWMVMRYKYVRL